MIRLDDKYPGRINPADANYPDGSIKNETIPNSSDDGTPLDQLWGNDIEGFKQAVINEAGITPSDNPETILESQWLIGLKQLLKTGRKNKLIGNFFINQRKVSGAVVLSAGVYGHDRFKAGSGGCTYTFATVNGVTTITISAGSLEQIIEAENIEAGDYILSWVGTAQGQIDGGGFGNSGDVTDTLDGSANVTIEFDTGTLALPQLELGTNVTAYERRPIGKEFDLCLRYFERLGQSDEASGYYAAGLARTTINVHAFVNFTPKRAKPSVSTSAIGNFDVVYRNLITPITALALTITTRTTVRFDITTASVLTAGDGIIVRDDGGANSTIDIDAEL